MLTKVNLFNRFSVRSLNIKRKVNLIFSVGKPLYEEKKIQSFIAYKNSN